MAYTVYCHRNKINNKYYVGLTKNEPKVRWGSNGINYKSCSLFYKAILKYNWDGFEHIILETNLSQEEASLYEQFYIKLFNAMSPNGYNLTGGGEKNKEISKETLQKLKESHKGIKYSLKTRQKMSESCMGHEGYNRIKVWMCDKNTHKRIKLFDSLTDAAKFIDDIRFALLHQHISAVCRGKRPSAYGYFWQYQGGDDLSHN